MPFPLPHPHARRLVTHGSAAAGDALCKALYSGVFTAIIDRLNDLLRAPAAGGGARRGGWIGLLDIFAGAAAGPDLTGGGGEVSNSSLLGLPPHIRGAISLPTNDVHPD